MVLCVDEKTAIQALDRKDPVLPLSPGRAERHGFEYVRHGTLSLYAALDTQTGEVQGKTTARHTSQEFVAFLTDIVVRQPEDREIHIILDNLSAHKTRRVQDFLDAHPNVTLHFTPTYSSWLNQVELWFSKIERDLIYRGVFTSVKDLSRRIMTYIRHYNDDPRPIKWQYDDPSRRIQRRLTFSCYSPLGACWITRLSPTPAPAPPPVFPRTYLHLTYAITPPPCGYPHRLGTHFSMVGEVQPACREEAAGYQVEHGGAPTELIGSARIARAQRRKSDAVLEQAGRRAEKRRRAPPQQTRSAPWP